MSDGVLSTTPLPEPLPQERFAPVGQLLIGPVDLTEERHEILVARLLGVLELGGARVSALKGLIEDADNMVRLISGASRVVACGHIPLLSEAWGHYGLSCPRPRFMVITMGLPPAYPRRRVACYGPCHWGSDLPRP